MRKLTCNNCGKEKWLHEAIVPNKCVCGGVYVEGVKEKYRKAVLKGYRQVNNDLAKFINEENDGETGTGHSVEVLTTAINRLYARLLEMKKETIC